MAFKALLFVCAQALLAQCVFGQLGYTTLLSSPMPTVTGNSVVENNVVVNSGANNINNLGLASSGLASSGLALGAVNSGAVLNTVANPNYINVASISGGGVLPVTSYSPIAPSGLTVLSDNVIEGALLVSGELPFLSAVAFEGGLATAGSGAASCGCGDGSIGIVSENVGSGLGLGGLGGLAGVSNLGGLRGLGRGGLVL
ncbi:chorion class B protein M2410-like [Amyelois transitella]|uniref:chorion class B protein M2410-like n=1 Tax=Amyelois transitella TaxID=680683 RepID=UPI00298F7C76|nr:chorion class B protein M2410-like [Amyelois transitella]